MAEWGIGISPEQLDISKFIKDVFIDMENQPLLVELFGKALQDAAKELTPAEKMEFGLSPTKYSKITNTFSNPLDFISSLLKEAFPSANGTDFIKIDELFHIPESGKTYQETLRNPSDDFTSTRKTISLKFLKSLFNEMGILDKVKRDGYRVHKQLNTRVLSQLRSDSVVSASGLGDIDAVPSTFEMLDKQWE